MALDVLYIDAHLIVIDKPAGLAVHPGPKTPDSLERRLGELTFGFRRLPQPAHRLDRDTSGCLVLARHPKALRRLSSLFSEGMTEKTYLAVLGGRPAGDSGCVEASLRKISSAAEGWRMVAAEDGAPAVTDWRLLEWAGGQSHAEFRPRTGRTHQIRVHAALLGAPIVGDPVYGGAPAPRMFLHASRVRIPYAREGAPIDVTAPLPADWPFSVS
jgi:tRNA pseudouridine32 synthase/23S rRNA pseudouridine746 synthase